VVKYGERMQQRNRQDDARNGKTIFISTTRTVQRGGIVIYKQKRRRGSAR
jgi:hypothetical protein